ncbi:MAG: DUF1801 domain-containing protein [Sphingomonas sp.]|uniref:DUF1801 domain-containing protein n=1 Tax=Sphingomonas sp. TaxID=28214 RepID=UPI0035A8E455|nr:DUF1801 domain-containing protein [Sphingomonas sp.]
MADNKTKPTDVPIDAYLASVEPPVRRQDAQVVMAMMKRISGEEARMWGPSIIGFGCHSYVYASGRSGETPRIAFSPRKPQLVLYVGASAPETVALLPALGKHTTGKGCLYIKNLADVDMAVLEQIVQLAFDRRV